MNEASKTQVLRQIAEHAVPDTMDLWPQIRSRVDAAMVPPPAPVGSASRARGWSRRLTVGLATGVFLALLLGGTIPLWNQTEPVSAQTILARAQSTANSPLGVTTYHLQMTRHLPAKDNQTMRREVWFGGSDRQRIHDQLSDASGATVSTLDVVFHGPEAWIATTENGQTRVVHTVGTIWTRPADDPSNHASLTDVLTTYSNDETCTTAQLQGEATMADRPTYVIVITPKPGGCATEPGPGEANQGKRGGPDAPKSRRVGQMRVWVDQQTFLPLKTEVRDPAGVVLEHVEVTSVQYNVPMPDSTFTYTPPAEATVSTFTGGTGADVKRTLSAGTPEPSKRP